MVTDTALWQAINAYELDNADAVFPFSRRLARDNGWSYKRALSAIAEYKRFICLICHFGTPPGTVLTPSEDVDEVWHLHLIYTQDYWNRFCGQALGRKIHHGPTRGGLVEDDRYMDCYRRTLEIYQREFGPPPRDTGRTRKAGSSPARSGASTHPARSACPSGRFFYALRRPRRGSWRGVVFRPDWRPGRKRREQ